MTYCYPFLSGVFRRPLTFEHFCLLLWKGWTNFNQIWYIATMGKGEHKLWISWSLPPWGLRGGAKTIKISAIFKNLLLYSWTSCSQTVCMIVISNKPSTKIVKFMAPGSGVLELEGFKDHMLCTLTVHYCLLDYLPLIVFMLFCVSVYVYLYWSQFCAICNMMWRSNEMCWDMRIQLFTISCSGSKRGGRCKIAFKHFSFYILFIEWPWNYWVLMIQLFS